MISGAPCYHGKQANRETMAIEPASMEDLTDSAALEQEKSEEGPWAKKEEKSGMEKKTSYNVQWTRDRLTTQALGKFCEYYAKMALLSYGVRIYTPEIDDHGIDFVAEGREGFLKFQVKGVRGLSQVFMEKKYFDAEDGAMYLVLILLIEGEEPDLYVIPASAWRRESPVFVSYDYEGKKSRPDYTVNVSRKNLPELEKYRLENMLSIF